MTDNTEMDIARGKEAQQLLANPLLKEAFALIEADLVAKWQASPVRDVEARESLYLSQGLLKRLQADLYVVIERGAIAEQSLAQRVTERLKTIGK